MSDETSNAGLPVTRFEQTRTCTIQSNQSIKLAATDKYEGRMLWPAHKWESAAGWLNPLKLDSSGGDRPGVKWSICHMHMPLIVLVQLCLFVVMTSTLSTLCLAVIVGLIQKRNWEKDKRFQLCRKSCPKLVGRIFKITKFELGLFWFDLPIGHYDTTRCDRCIKNYNKSQTKTDMLRRNVLSWRQ